MTEETQSGLPPIFPNKEVLKTEKKTFFLKPIFLVVFILVLVVGIYYYFFVASTRKQNLSNQFPEESISEEVPGDSQEEEVVGWKTYSNPNVPFTFDYPSELSNFVKEEVDQNDSNNILINIQNYEDTYPTDFETNEDYFNFLIMGQTGQDFVSILNDPNLGLEKEGRELISIDGIEAYVGIGMTNGETGVNTAMFQYRDWVFIIRGQPNQSNKLVWFDQIVSSIKFVD